MGHQLFAQDVLPGIEGVHGERRVPVEGNGDHDGLDVLVGQEFVVIVILLDFAGGRFAQLADQAHAVVVAVAHEGPQAVRGANVGHRHDVHIFRRMLGEEDIPLVARADEADAHPVSFELLIAEVGGSQADRAGCGGLEKITAADVGVVQSVGDAIEILRADLDLFGRQLHGESLIYVDTEGGAGLAVRRLPGTKTRNRRSMPNHWPVGMQAIAKRAMTSIRFLLTMKLCSGPAVSSRSSTPGHGWNCEIKRQEKHGRGNCRRPGGQTDHQQSANPKQSPDRQVVDLLLRRPRLGNGSPGELWARQEFSRFLPEIGIEGADGIDQLGPQLLNLAPLHVEMLMLEGLVARGTRPRSV